MVDDRDTAHDDVELGERENDAFLPGSGAGDQRSGGSRKRGSNNILTCLLPPKLKSFVENLSRLKVCLFLSCRVCWSYAN